MESLELSRDLFHPFLPYMSCSLGISPSTQNPQRFKPPPAPLSLFLPFPLSPLPPPLSPTHPSKKKTGINPPSTLLSTPSRTLLIQSLNFVCAARSCWKEDVRCCRSCVSWFLRFVSCAMGRDARSTVFFHRGQVSFVVDNGGKGREDGGGEVRDGGRYLFGAACRAWKPLLWGRFGGGV